MATQSLDNFRSTSFKMSKILMYWNLTWPEDVWLRKGLEMEMFLDYLKWIRSPGSVPLSILPSPPLHHPLILCFIFCPTALSTTSLTTIFLPDLKRKHFFLRASLVAEWFKKKKKKICLWAQEMQAQCLCRNNPLVEGMAAHPSILAWEIPWTENLVGYSPWGCKESDTT